jgi:hypothetical protein
MKASGLERNDAFALRLSPEFIFAIFDLTEVRSPFAIPLSKRLLKIGDA